MSFSIKWRKKTRLCSYLDIRVPRVHRRAVGVQMREVVRHFGLRDDLLPRERPAVVEELLPDEVVLDRIATREVVPAGSTVQYTTT